MKIQFMYFVHCRASFFPIYDRNAPSEINPRKNSMKKTVCTENKYFNKLFCFKFLFSFISSRNCFRLKTSNFSLAVTVWEQGNNTQFADKDSKQQIRIWAEDMTDNLPRVTFSFLVGELIKKQVLGNSYMMKRLLTIYKQPMFLERHTVNLWTKAGSLHSRYSCFHWKQKQMQCTKQIAQTQSRIHLSPILWMHQASEQYKMEDNTITSWVPDSRQGMNLTQSSL